VSGAAVLLILLAFATTGVLILVGVALMVPVVDEARKLARIEAETADAAWKIHQQATSAFGQMLDTARDVTRETDR
jgi:hypothetical protein